MTARRASEASHPARPTNVKKRPKGAFLLSVLMPQESEAVTHAYVKAVDITIAFDICLSTFVTHIKREVFRRVEDYPCAVRERGGFSGNGFATHVVVATVVPDRVAVSFCAATPPNA